MPSTFYPDATSEAELQNAVMISLVRLQAGDPSPAGYEYVFRRNDERVCVAGERRAGLVHQRRGALGGQLFTRLHISAVIEMLARGEVSPGQHRGRYFLSAQDRPSATVSRRLRRPVTAACALCRLDHARCLGWRWRAGEPTNARRWLAPHSKEPPSSTLGGRPEQRVPCITQSGSSSIRHVSSSA